ncbi:MAG: hypothetical protein M1821_007363 [Bathelium mastoideum]|nr:MAG: hypothetical protein M1821_007363 [Bathelium mastoideum]
MTRSLCDLPNELQLAITDFVAIIDRRDILNLSTTCTHFRTLLTPEVFKVVRLQNTEESGLHVQSLADTRKAACVEELHYVGSTRLPNELLEGEEEPEGLQQDFYNAEDDDVLIDSVLPEVVHSVLSQLSRFPILRTLTIRFSFNLSCMSEPESSLYNEYEMSGAARDAESVHRWRALMAKTYQAVSNNEATSIRSLQIRDLIPKWVTVFGSKNFNRFLGSLEHCKIEMHDYTYGTESSGIDIRPGYREFCSRLDEAFFSHLNSVTRIDILAFPTAKVVSRVGLLPLRPGLMKRLTSIYLKNFLITPFFAALLGHFRMLETIRMHDCYVCEKTGGFWATFFDFLANMKPHKLRHIEVWPLHLMPLNIDHRDREKLQELVQSHAYLENDSHRCLFPYAEVDESSHFISGRAKVNLNERLAGRDQRAWARLRNIMDDNLNRIAE